MAEIAQADVSDFLPIAKLDREAWGRNNHARYIPDGEHAWRLWVEHATVFKAVRGGEIVGAILGFPCRDGTYCVHKVFTEERLRGQGIGTLLFQALLAELDARGKDTFLTVDPANERALRLYEKWGYSGRVFVQGFYRDCEDRFVLKRPAHTHPPGGNGSSRA